MTKRHCICKTFHETNQACLAPATQEDLLCDACRVWETRNREVRAGKRSVTGIHASGIDGRHQQWNATAQELRLTATQHKTEPDGTWRSTGEANLPDTEPKPGYHRYSWELPQNLEDLIGQQGVFMTRRTDANT